MSTLRPATSTCTLLCLAALGCAGLEPLSEDADGVWKARRPGGGEHIRLELYRGPSGHRSTPRSRLVLHVGEVEGLDEDAFRSSSEPLVFRLRREAGDLVFEGTRKRRPSGSFRFEASAAFEEQMERLGLGDDGGESLIRFAMSGVSMELVEALAASGITGRDPDDLLRLHRYDLSPGWIAAMARLEGPPTIDDLIGLRNRGVHERDVERWIDFGLQDRPAQELLRLHLHGASLESIARYRELGFEDLDEWLLFQRNGVPESLVAAATTAGVAKTDATQIVRLHMHGVGADEVTDAARLTAAGLDWEGLLYLWRRGVSTRYAERLIESDWHGLDEKGIARLAMAGVEADWALRVRDAGDDPNVDELITLRRSGLRASDYEGYAAEGYRDIDEVRSFVLAGVEPEWIGLIRDRMAERPDAEDLVLLARRGIDSELLRQLSDAGIDRLAVEDLIAAHDIGVESWIGDAADR